MHSGDSKRAQPEPECVEAGRDGPGLAKRARWSSVREREADRLRAWRAAVVDRLQAARARAAAPAAAHGSFPGAGPGPADPAQAHQVRTRPRRIRSLVLFEVGMETG